MMKYTANKFLQILIVLSSFANVLVPSNALAQTDLVTKIFTGRFTTKNPNEARTRILEQATDQMTEDFISQFIGNAKYRKNRTLIHGRIVSQSGRYIPLVKTHDILADGDGFKMSVEMQISPSKLEQMLLEQGLLYDNEGSPIIIPLISFEDQNSSMQWWMQTQSDSLKGFQTQIEKMLQKRFFENGFYMEKSSQFNFGRIFPKDFKKSTFSSEELQSLGPKIGAQIFLTGRIQVSPSPESSGAFAVDLSITATQVANGRLMAEVVRKFTTDHGDLQAVLTSRKFLTSIDVIIKDISTQILEAWQKGTFGATLAQIFIQGKVPPSQYAGLKDALKSKSRLIRQVRERLISQDGVVFEVDISGPLDQVAKTMNEFTVGETKYKLKSLAETKLVIEKLGL